MVCVESSMVVHASFTFSSASRRPAIFSGCSHTLHRALLRWDTQHQMDVVRHGMTFDELHFLLATQLTDGFPNIPVNTTRQNFLTVLRYYQSLVDCYWLGIVKRGASVFPNFKYTFHSNFSSGISESTQLILCFVIQFKDIF